VIPLWAPSISLNSKEVFGLTSFALSLLLVFRTNARCSGGVGAGWNLQGDSLSPEEPSAAPSSPALSHRASASPATTPSAPSYERWDGARKMWGLVLNRSRDFVRQGLSYFPSDRPELKEMLVRWTPAFSKSLMCHLRKDDDYVEVLKVRACVGGGGKGFGGGLWERVVLQFGRVRLWWCAHVHTQSLSPRHASASDSAPALPAPRTSCCPTSWTPS
jgi:hypothetical protein